MEEEGFSIREYASRMRNVNVVKCWPFDEITSEETVKSLLPPITIKKFTYWLDGLGYLRSKLDRNVENFKKKKKNKIVQEKGEISSKSEEDVEESDCDVEQGIEIVKVKSLKGKAKTLKKRSIVEIFAVAPQVERVSSEDDEDECSVQENYAFYDFKPCLKGKRMFNHENKKKQKKNKEIILSKLKPKKVINKFKKNKKGDGEMDLPVGDKENHFKLKLQAQNNAIENPSSSYSKESEINMRDHVSTHKRKARLQYLDANKKNTVHESSKSIAENSNPELLVTGILKNCTKLLSLQQSMNHIFLEEPIQVTNCGKQKANKHVTFLEKDCILRQRNKPSLSAECLNLQQKFCGSDADTVAAMGVGKDSSVEETSGREAFFSRIENEVDAELETEWSTLPRCTVDNTNFLMQHKRGLFVNSVATDQTEMHGMNQHLLKNSLREAQHYSYPPGFFYMPLEGYCGRPNIKVVKNPSSSMYGRLIEDFGMSHPRIPSEDYLKEYQEPPANKTFSLHAMENYNACPFEYQTFPRHSPKELLVNLYPPSDRNQAGIICGKRSTNENFVGLPLNSQGEFITLNSSGKRDFNQVMQSGVAAAPSISLCQPANAISNFLDHQLECRSWDCGTSPRDQLNLFPVEGCVKEKPVVSIPSGSDDTECQGKWRTNFDLDAINVNNHSFHSDNSICKDDNQVQKCHGNEKIQSTMRLMGKEFIVGGRGFQGFEDGNHWKDKPIIDELHFGNTSIKNVMMHHQNEPSLLNPGETLASLTYQNGFTARKINPSQICISQGTFPEVQNSEYMYLDPFTRGYESQVFSLELPTSTLSHKDSCSNVISSAIQLKNKQNVPSIPRSAIKFPFMHPDVEGHAQSSWSWSSPTNPSGLFFDTLEKGTGFSYCQSHYNLGRNHNPRAMIDLRSSVPLHCSAPAPSPAPAPAPAPLIQHPQRPCYPGLIPISSMQKRNRRRIKEQNQSRMGMRGIDQIKKAQRKHSATSDISVKLSKMPSLEFEEDDQDSVTKSVTHVDFEGNFRNTESGFEQRIYPWMDSYRGTVSGPVKLSTHSNIPFAATTSGFKFLGSGTSTNLYTF